ncbi:hypothetical protein, unknown function [Leishmania tarentolae]|uniref:Uncharacterized protein n=1 Tax=Leishmania tarentolae TaxID=5689 RepID=A0A640KL69_LEITA|nr:hypothetical protein, unknown function [Leishmania tarentolae]
MRVMVPAGPKESSPTLSKLTLKSAAPQPTSTSLQNVSSNSTVEITDALSLSSGVATTVITGTSARSCSSCFSPYTAGSDSVSALQDFDTHGIEAEFASLALDLSDLSPSASTAGVSHAVEQPPASVTQTLPKRKYPSLLTQLAHEIRWMHKNLRHGYNSNATPRVGCIYGASPSLRSLTSDSTCIDEEKEELLCKTSLRSSMRYSSPLKNTMMNHSDSDLRHHAHGAASSRNPCRRRLHRGKVEQVQPVTLPEVIPDPYAPPSCQYVVQNFAVMVTGGDAFGRACNGSPSSSIMRAAYGDRVDEAAVFFRTNPVAEPALSPGEASRMEDTYWGHGYSLSAVDFSRGDTSDVELVDQVDGSPADLGGLMVDCACSASGIHKGAPADGDAAASSDPYQVFFSGVMDLQRQLHSLGQKTASLRSLYEQEQRARLRFKGKGQHLSWTRTVEAANTIYFWRQKVSILRLFESQYLSMLKSFQHELQLVDPNGEKAQQLRRSPESTADKSGATTSVMQARRRFVSSLQVISVQEQHLQKLGEQMEACWKANAILREELRHFEHREVRVPHSTFATAGMDAEHFIASLPPRTSVFGFHSVLSHTSVQSLDSLGSTETPMLLTAQNLSFISSGDDSDGEVVKAVSTHSIAAIHSNSGSNRSARSVDHTTPQPLGDSAASAVPLVWCMKPASIVSSTQLSPVLPKRLKCVIRSVTLDHEECGGDNSSSRIAPSYSNLSAPTTGSQTRLCSERHVTFALEPEVLDARPRLSSHSRTVELLEQICLDKQSPCNSLPLMQSALEERLTELAQLRGQFDGAVASEAPTLMPIFTPPPCTTTTSSTGDIVNHSRDEATVPSQKLFPSAAISALRKKSNSSQYRKVKPEECSVCSIM